MPSPIAHLAAGYALYRLAQRRWPQLDQGRFGPFSRLAVITAGLSLAPDADTVVGLLAGDLGRFHNNVTHSLFVGVAISLVFAGAIHWRRGRGFWPWLAVGLAGYGLHVLMDAATVGRGVMAYWPLTAARYQAPLIVFYGLHWYQGWVSPRHVWTVVTEMAFLASVLVLVRRLTPRRAPTLGA